MKTLTSIALGTALILGTSSLAFAGSTNLNRTPSGVAPPGQNKMTGSGSGTLNRTPSGVAAPGLQDRSKASGPGASSFAPGHNKSATTGSTGGTTRSR